MYADNQFLTALSMKLTEISEECIDMDTKSELDELIEKIVDQIEVQAR